MKLFISMLLLFAVGISFSFDIDSSAMNIHDEAFERAMISFTLAKGLNAVISLIQGTELSFTPIGIGLNFSVGEVLDPFNDIVERFSWIMLAASVSLGIQKLLLIISSKIFLQIALASSVLISIFFMWNKSYQYKAIAIFSYKTLIIILLLRFSAIIFIYSSSFFYNAVLNEDFNKSNQVLSSTKEELEAVQNQNKKLIDKKTKTSWYEVNIKSNVNLSQKLDNLSQSIDKASRSIIELITIFIVQDILMPLLFLWLFFFFVKYTFKTEYFSQLNSTQ